MRNKFNEVLVEAMQRDDQMMAGIDFNNKFIEIDHSDGSKFHFKYAKMEKKEVMNLPCILIFAEHVSPQIFVEYDLEKMVLQPWKGKATKYVLAKDPREAIILKIDKKKKAVKKVAKKATKKTLKKSNKRK